MPLDLRCQIGAPVQAKASRITSEQECQRLFGKEWKNKVFLGLVRAVIRTKVNGRFQTSLDVTWQAGLRHKRKTTRLQNVKLGHVLMQDDKFPERQIEPDFPFEAEPCTRNTEQSPPTTPGDSQREVTMTGINTEASTTGVCQNENSAEAHGCRWQEATVSLPLNGQVELSDCVVKMPDGSKIRPGVDEHNRELLDYFIAMFPMEYLGTIVRMTNTNLTQGGKKGTTAGELIKLFGVILLITRFEFSARADLWKTEPISEFIPAPCLGKAISRNRFDELRQHICFSAPPAERGSLSSIRYRWAEVSDFVHAFNRHRVQYVIPSESICVDESMIKWYGKGGSWLNDGLPHYVAFDRKPENGAEIQNAACGRGGFMLRLEIVSSKEDEADRMYERETGHGTAVLKRLLELWFGTGRVVCADSYFASVEAAKELWDVGLRLIGTVKTATKEFPWQHLTRRVMNGRGDWSAMHCAKSEKNPDMMSLVWVDRNRHYFIATASTSLPGPDMIRKRYGEEGGEGTDGTVTIIVKRPKAVKWFYDVSPFIDRHNRIRQDDICIERKFDVKHWALRVHTSILAMCFADAWLLYKGGRGSREHLPLHSFLVQLSSEMINNTYDRHKFRRLTIPASSVSTSLEGTPLRSGLREHLTPTKQLRKTKDGCVTKYFKQKCCRVCKKKKSTHICSKCADMGTHVFLCHTKSKRDCFIQHLDEQHGLFDFRQSQFD